MHKGRRPARIHAGFAAEMSFDAPIRGSMDSPLGSLLRRSPVSCLPQEPIRSVLETMHKLAIGSMIVTAEDNTPLGIFTLRDVPDRVALAGQSLDAPVSAVMSTDLTILAPEAAAHDAALAMVRDGIRHVVVVKGGKLVGVVSEQDLFRLQRLSLSDISTAVRGAHDLDSVRQLSRDIAQLAHSMLVQGIAAENLMRIISSLNDILTQRVIALQFADIETDEIPFCWLIMGSGGRFEQTFSTDQDNGIIFATPASMSRDEVRRRFLPAAQRINETLDQCGFPLCKGGIMASNPDWCLSLEEWQGKFARWIDRGDPESLLHGSIFFDFRPLYGDLGLGETLRHWLVQHSSANPRFLHQMAANAVRNRPPLGLVRDFVLARDGAYRHTLDLKLNGSTPFVDAARIYSLACGVAPTSTSERLRLVAPKLNIPMPEVEAWLQAFFFIQLLRLRSQHAEYGADLEMNNRLDPDQLNELDRRILKEALRQARKLQRRLAMDYRV